MKQNEEQTWLQRVTGSLYGLTLSERQLRSRRRGRYIFTDKKHPWRGVLSVVLGMLACVCLVLSVTLTFHSGQAASGGYAVGAVLGLAFAVTGLVTGIVSHGEKDIYQLFPRIGIAVNILVTCLVGGILFLGITG